MTQVQSTTRAWVERVPSALTPIGGGGASDTFKGRLDDGTSVAVRRIPWSDPESGEKMLEHLRRLAGLDSPNLVPLRGAFFDGNHLWVISELQKGSSLARMMDLFPFSPGQATAVTLSVLDGLSVLQRAGLSHGSLEAESVHIGRDGLVRIGDYALKPRFRPGQSAIGWPDPKADVVKAGLLLCAALNIPAQAEAEGSLASERSVPAVAVVARAMAEGRLGRDASAAASMLEDAAGSLASRQSRARSLKELGVLAGGTGGAVASSVSNIVRAPAAPPTPESATPKSVTPVATGVATAEPAAQPAAARGGQSFTESRRRPTPLFWLLGGAAAVAAILLLAIFPAIRLAGARTSPSRPQAAAPAKAAAKPSAQPPVASTPDPGAQPADSSAQAPAADSGAAPAPGAQLAGTGGAGSPTDAVGGFYSAVANHQFGSAAGYWSPRMRANWPPATYIDQRFQPTQSMRLNSASVVSTDGSTAVVAIDLYEVYSGQTRHWKGTWSLVQGGDGTWLLDAPNLYQG